MRIAYLISVCLLSIQLFSQETVLKDDTLSILYSDHTATLEFIELPYTSLNHFQQYRLFGRNRLPLARSGNLGLPIHSYELNYQDWTVDANLGGYQSYLMRKENLKFYDVSRPFTQLNYTNGSESEQLFQVLHTQNFGEGLNVSIEYQRIVSEGYFLNQLTNHTQFNTTYNLESRNSRFRSTGFFYVNDIESQENGGLRILDDEGDNTILLDVNLENAQNQSVSQGYGFTNGYDLFLIDSQNVLLNISHEINWERSHRLFKDVVNQEEPQYTTFVFDSSRTVDTSFAQQLSNALQFNFFNNKMSLGLRNERYQYFQNYLLDDAFESNFITAHVKGELFNQQVETVFEKGISGFHRNEVDATTSIEFQEWKGIQAKFEASIRQKQADYFVQNQVVNQFFIRENFATSNQSGLNLELTIPRFNLVLAVGTNEYQNFIYYDSLARPKQLENTFSSFYFNLEHKLTFFNHLHLHNKLKLQEISEEKAVPLPSIFSYHSLYYENVFFKNNFLLQFGFDFYYIGEYQGYSYNPSLTQFHLSGNDSPQLGRINQLDFFLNFRIEKATRVFVKMENILSEPFAEKTYRIQNYAIPGRSVKVGLSWRMVN